MTAHSENAARSRINWKRASLLIVAAGVAVFVAANAHLIYVAFDSQPDCVPHSKSTDDDNAYRAARSAC